MSSISISIIYYYCCCCCCCYDNHRGDSLTARMDWQQLKSSVMQALVLRKTCCQPYLSAHNHLHNEPSCQYHSINYIYVVMIAPAASFCPDWWFVIGVIITDEHGHLILHQLLEGLHHRLVANALTDVLGINCLQAKLRLTMSWNRLLAARNEADALTNVLWPNRLQPKLRLMSSLMSSE